MLRGFCKCLSIYPDERFGKKSPLGRKKHRGGKGWSKREGKMCRLTFASGTSPIPDLGYAIIQYILVVREIFYFQDRAGLDVKISPMAFCAVWRSERGCRPVELRRSPGHPQREAGYLYREKSSEPVLYAALWCSDC